jgi:hypothetical protein
MSEDGGVADVFELVDHPGRLSIVEVLIDAQRTDGETRLRFTDLRDRSDIDDTGRFNYHLDQLLGTFVTKTEAGYRLSSYAHRITAPMMGGIYDPERATDAVATPGECPDCGSDLLIETDETVPRLVCEQEHVVNQGLLGYPGVVGDYPPDAASEALGRINAQSVELAVAGTCPTCHGPVDGEITESAADSYHFEAPCDTCGNQFAHTVGGCVQTHPEVVSFLYDHGVDVRQTEPWALPFVYPGRETVASTDPLRLSVDVHRGGETLTVTVDRTAAVVSTERLTA